MLQTIWNVFGLSYLTKVTELPPEAHVPVDGKKLGGRRGRAAYIMAVDDFARGLKDAEGMVEEDIASTKVQRPELGAPPVIWTLEQELEYGRGGLNIRRLGATTTTSNSTGASTAAIQAAVDESEAGAFRKIYIPESDSTDWYLVDEPIIYGARGIIIEGGGYASQVHANCDGFAFDRTSGGNFPRVFQNFRMDVVHATGSGIRMTSSKVGECNSLDITVRGAGIGIHVKAPGAIDDPAFPNSFTNLIRSCRMRTPANPVTGSIGIMLDQHSKALACDIVGYDAGIQTKGPASNVDTCRLEVNNTGLVLGKTFAGVDDLTSSSVISGNTFEGNLVGIDIISVQSTVIQGGHIRGGTNAPPDNAGQAVAGIRIKSFRASRIGQINFATSFDDYCIGFVSGGTIDNSVIEGLQPSVNSAGELWSLNAAALAGVKFIQTNSGALEGSATFNPSDLADGAGETTTVAVTGAALGDYAEASFSLSTQGIMLFAWVSAADTVSVRFQNESGGSVNLGSGTLKARVRKSGA